MLNSNLFITLSLQLTRQLIAAEVEIEYNSYIVINLCLIYLCYSLFKLKGRVMGPVLVLVCPCLSNLGNFHVKEVIIFIYGKQSLKMAFIWNKALFDPFFTMSLVFVYLFVFVYFVFVFCFKYTLIAVSVFFKTFLKLS